MAKEYTIPQLLSIAGIRGYTPRLSSAINSLLNTKSEIEYQSALKVATKEITGYNNISINDGVEIDSLYQSNHFNGLPIYMPLLFNSLTNSNEEYLLESAIVEINRQKNIIVTQVQGRDTTIKELINNGDYQISVSGLICKKGFGYPKNEVKEFESFMKAKKSIAIIHEVLNAIGVYELVITDYGLPHSSFTNVQPYSFNAISDEPIELTINEKL